MTVLTEKILEEILSYLEKSINNLAKETFKNLEFEEGFQGAENFLQNQFDIIIQRKQMIFGQISKQYKN